MREAGGGREYHVTWDVLDWIFISCSPFITRKFGPQTLGPVKLPPIMLLTKSYTWSYNRV